MLNDKDIKILNTIYQNKSPMNIKELANLCNLSPRSIRNYIDKINENFNFKCIELNLGICSITNDKIVSEFLESCHLSYFSSELITKYMLYQVVTQDEINLTHIAEKFEISRTSAKNYLTSLKNSLVSYHLKIEHNPKKGLVLLGKEIDKRRLLISLLLKFDKLESIEKRTIYSLVKIYFDEYYKTAVDLCIVKLRQYLLFSLSDESYKTLYYYFVTTIARVKRDFLLETNLNKAFIKSSKEYKIIKPMVAGLETMLNTTINEDEFVEIVDIVMGLNYSNNRETEYTNWFEYDLFISKIIRRFSSIYESNLVYDYELYDNLLHHIKPTMYRISNKIKLSDFDYGYIIKEANREYNIVKKILIELNFFPQNEHIEYYRDEIALICLHFKTAVDRNANNDKRNKKLLVVCSYGYGTSRLVMKRILETYDVKKIDTIALYELKNTNVSEYDLIISVIGEENFDTEKTVLKINPIMGKEDFELLSLYLAMKKYERIKISKLLSIICNEKTLEEKKIIANKIIEGFPNNFINDMSESQNQNILIPIENIIIDYDGKNISDVISKAGDLLVSNGYADESYKRDLISSFENYGDYMMIGEDVAIPHTKNNNNVLRTGFTFIRLKEPIKFKGNYISMLFTFCSKNNKDHLDSLILISNIINDYSQKQTLQTLNTREKVADLFAMLNTL